MIHPPAIVAPDQVVHSWREAATRSLSAANRPLDPALHRALGQSPQEVVELVVYLSEALTHAGGVFVASVANARPEVAVAFHDGLRDLLNEVVVQQETDRGQELPQPCPLPQNDGTPFACGCGPAGRKACAELAFDAGSGELPIDRGEGRPA